MTRRAVSVMALAAVFVAAVFVSMSARQRPGELPQWEYLRLGLVAEAGGDFTSPRLAYQACVAGTAEWRCREFAVEDNRTDEALRLALATVGFEGWELVTLAENVPTTFAQGPVYLFKRPLLR